MKFSSSIHVHSFVVVQFLSRIWLFATPWTAACQASLSFTIWSLLKLMSIESVMLSNISSSDAIFSSCPRSFPTSASFPVSQFFASGGPSTGASASASVLPVNIQGWFPLGLTGLISLLSKGLSRVFSSTIHSVFAHLKNCGCLLHTSPYAHRGEEATLSRHWLGLMLLKRDSCQLKGFQLGGPTALRNWRPLLIFHFWM